MVAVARIINATLVIPELDKRSFWQDTRYFSILPFTIIFFSFVFSLCIGYHLIEFYNFLFSNFSDIFDEEYFMNSLANDVKIIKKLPKELVNATRVVKQFISWSGMDYYENEIASLWEDYQVCMLEVIVL